jgi:hypothetical protein
MFYNIGPLVHLFLNILPMNGNIYQLKKMTNLIFFRELLNPGNGVASIFVFSGFSAK